MFSAALTAAVVLSAQSGEPPPSSISRTFLLANDASLPVSASAAAAFEAGDQSLVNTPAQAFDSWWRALQSSKTGESVRVLGTENAARAPTEGVECAFLRRLRALDATERSAWRARFEPLALRALEQAGDDLRALALVERNFAGTRAAVIGALRAGDGAHEAGRADAARCWWSRAEDQLALLAPRDGALTAALALRTKPNTDTRSELAEIDPDLRRETLTLELAAPDPHAGLAPEREPGAGLAVLADGRLAVEVGERFVLVDAGGAWRTVEPQGLLDRPEWSWPPAYRDLEQAWPQRPLAVENRIVAVLGRSRAGHGNALVCFDPGSEGVLPRLIWAWTAAGWIGPEGPRESQNQELSLGAWEFEPGPLQQDGQILVVAQRLDPRIEADLLCFDIADGRLIRRTVLGNGADPRTNERPKLPPQPRPFGPTAGLLGEADGCVFVSTGLGFAALVEACDGRVLWSVRAARAAGGVFAGTLPAAPQNSAADRSWTWSPPEAAETLVLPGTAAADAFALAGAHSEPRQGELAAFELDGARTLRLGQRSGRLLLWGADWESVSLATGERAQAALTLGRTRIALATDRAVYVFSSADGRLILRRELGGERSPSPASGQLTLVHGRLVLADPRHVRAWSLR